MKAIDAKDLAELPGVPLTPGETFTFRCHSGLACFNLCCRNLNLYLYPYDILRLKNRLAISSDAFLERHVDVVLRPGNFFPDVLLRMADTAERTCPFLSPSGCSVYPDRPDTCRTFPVERGLLYDAQTQTDTEIYFLRPPDFCLGPKEDKRWTVSGWMDDQEAGVHQAMTLGWAKLKRLFLNDPWGAEGPQGTRAKMAFMATYNIDRFREFVFASSFLERYRLKRDLLSRVKADDTELLKLGFDWVRFFLWGLPSRRFRQR
jgi:Fe-S-cluster containining protein